MACSELGSCNKEHVLLIHKISDYFMNCHKTYFYILYLGLNRNVDIFISSDAGPELRDGHLSGDHAAGVVAVAVHPCLGRAGGGGQWGWGRRQVIVAGVHTKIVLMLKTKSFSSMHIILTDQSDGCSDGALALAINKQLFFKLKTSIYKTKKFSNTAAMNQIKSLTILSFGLKYKSACIRILPLAEQMTVILLC